MTRKYQIFISSSFVDLKEHRKELIFSILRDGHIPFGMEMLNPCFIRSLNIIEEKICESDIFVILVGARLGTRIDEKEDSFAFTEQEFEIAKKYKLPIIAFLLNDDEYKEARNSIHKGDPEREKDKKLDDFREMVKKVNGGTRIVGFFSYKDTGHLCEQHTHAISECISKLENNGGWVEGKVYDSLKKTIHLDTLVSNNPFFQDLSKHLNRFDKLSVRTTIAADLKKGIASYFWRRYFAKVHTKKIKSIFFESGSSIAYVSQEFINQIHKQSAWFYEQKMNEKIKIKTNNVLSYLDFIFQESPWKPMDVMLLPQGPFSDDYGGTFGILNYAVQESAPSPKDVLRKCLPSNTQALVDEVKETFEAEFNNNGLVLMTASGVDTRPLSTDAPYPGPHVGSYPNMLLKRSLLALQCPKVLFLHPDKWGFQFRFNNCHAVCDNSFPWSNIIDNSPIAIAIATETRDRQQKVADDLFRHGFIDIDLEEPLAGNQGPWSIIAANKNFSDFLKEL